MSEVRSQTSEVPANGGGTSPVPETVEPPRRGQDPGEDCPCSGCAMIAQPPLWLAEDLPTHYATTESFAAHLDEMTELVRRMAAKWAVAYHAERLVEARSAA